MEGKLRWDCCQYCDEMVFECYDYFFFFIGLIRVWWDDLELNFISAYLLIDCYGALVVHDASFWVYFSVFKCVWIFVVADKCSDAPLLFNDSDRITLN